MRRITKNGHKPRRIASLVSIGGAALLLVASLAQSIHASPVGSPPARDQAPGFSGGTIATALTVPAGSESAPGLVVGSTANGGIYSTSNTLYFTTNTATRLRLNGGNLFVYGALSLGNGNSYMQSPSSGVVTLSDVDDDGFARLQFGGTTSSFPSIKQSSAKLAFRLADDSADASITTAGIIATAATAGEAGTKATGNGTGVGLWGIGGATDALAAYFDGGGTNGGGIYVDGRGTGVAITAVARGGHGASIESDTTSPVKAALHIEPQDAEPTGPNAVGNLYVTTAGVLKICTVAGTPGTWVSVGAQ